MLMPAVSKAGAKHGVQSFRCRPASMVGAWPDPRPLSMQQLRLGGDWGIFRQGEKGVAQHLGELTLARLEADGAQGPTTLGNLHLLPRLGKSCLNQGGADPPFAARRRRARVLPCSQIRSFTGWRTRNKLAIARVLRR